MSASILLVEDNPACEELFFYRWVARFPEHKFVVAASYAECQRVFEEPRNFLLVALDLHLPDDPMGLQTFRLCRQHAPDTLLICISGHIEEQHHRLFQSLGGIYLCRKGSASLDLLPIFKLLDHAKGDPSQ